MNESFYLPKASLVLHKRELKEDDDKQKQNAEQYGLREGSLVGVSFSFLSTISV